MLLIGEFNGDLKDSAIWGDHGQEISGAGLVSTGNCDGLARS